jgi:hypothetical protein
MTRHVSKLLGAAGGSHRTGLERVEHATASTLLAEDQGQHPCELWIWNPVSCSIFHSEAQQVAVELIGLAQDL